MAFIYLWCMVTYNVDMGVTVTPEDYEAKIRGDTNILTCSVDYSWNTIINVSFALLRSPGCSHTALEQDRYFISKGPKFKHAAWMLFSLQAVIGIRSSVISWGHFHRCLFFFLPAGNLHYPQVSDTGRVMQWPGNVPLLIKYHSRAHKQGTE